MGIHKMHPSEVDRGRFVKTSRVDALDGATGEGELRTVRPNELVPNVLGFSRIPPAQGLRDLAADGQASGSVKLEALVLDLDALVFDVGGHWADTTDHGKPAIVSDEEFLGAFGLLRGSIELEKVDEN